jgi:hypothetical protein
MKKLLFAVFLIPAICVADKKIQTTRQEDRILETVIEDADEWIQSAWNRKVRNIKDYLIKSEIEWCLGQNKKIPEDEEEILKQALKRHKTRRRQNKEREQD